VIVDVLSIKSVQVTSLMGKKLEWVEKSKDVTLW